MAKYVGKIFRVSNNVTKVRGNGAHFVKITWFNPFKRIFRGKVITSLETELDLKKKRNKAKILNNSAYHVVSQDKVNMFKRTHYEDLRNGVLKPIPINDEPKLKHWSAYAKTVDIKISDIKGKKPL